MWVMLEEIIRHMQRKEVENVYSVTYIISGKSYHIMALKEPDYIMLMMTTYGTLENLEGSEMQWRCKVSGG